MNTDEFISAMWPTLPSNSWVFSGTIRENIAYYHEGIDETAILEASKKAGIRLAIEALPEGYDTVLGPGASGLSGGQLQRVGIAPRLPDLPQ